MRIIIRVKISRRYFRKLGFKVNVYRKIMQSRKFSRNSFVNLNVVPLKHAIDCIALGEMKLKCAHWILFAFVFARARSNLRSLETISRRREDVGNKIVSNFSLRFYTLYCAVSCFVSV